MAAADSVIECALMGNQQTHEPKKAVRWRWILKLGRGNGGAPKSRSLLRGSLRFFAALFGLGLLSYLVFRTGAGTVWKQLEAVGWGLPLVISWEGSRSSSKPAPGDRRSLATSVNFRGPAVS